MAHIFAGAFVETGPQCDGPRYIATQPNREHGGVLLMDKYVTEFNVPVMNVGRSIADLKKNWNKLTDVQKSELAAIFEPFGNVGPAGALGDGSNAALDYIMADPVNNIPSLLNQLASNATTAPVLDKWAKDHRYFALDTHVNLIIASVIIAALVIGLLFGRSVLR